MPIPDSSVAIDRRLMRDEVFERLRDAIVDGTFAPGEQLKDTELAQWLAVSRTPVREALLRLSEAGLVVATPGRSTIVSTLDMRAVREARDVVAALHELAVREAVPNINRAEVQQMRAANRRFRQAIKDGDVEAALRADDDFHAIPVTVTDNSALSAVLEWFTPLLRRAERLRFSTLDARASVQRHEELIKLIQAGDVEGAAAAAFGTWHSLPTTDES